MRLLLIRLIDLVENTAVCEMSLLGLLPIAHNLRQRKQLYFRKLTRVLFRDRFGAWTVVALRSDRLPLGAVEILQIFLGDGASSLLVHNLVDDAHRRLAEHADRGDDDLKLV